VADPDMEKGSEEDESGIHILDANQDSKSQAPQKTSGKKIRRLHLQKHGQRRYRGPKGSTDKKVPVPVGDATMYGS